MSTRRYITLAAAAVGASALLLGSAVGGRAQTPPPGTIQTPNTILVPPESVLPLSDILAFSGTAHIQTDNANGVLPCVSNDEPDNPAEVDLVGCGGTFSFGSDIACAGVSDPNPDFPGGLVPEGPNCFVTANGTFENAVCGSGYVQGNVNVTSGADAGEGGSFGIVFVGTIGVVTSNISGDYGVGVVQLGPPVPPSAPTPPDCTPAFTVTSVDVLFDL